MTRRTTHGFTAGPAKSRRVAPEYSTWSHVIQRCTNRNNAAYYNYGGRGITVCDRWLNSFVAFLEDMGRRPSPQHSIDRINNEGNYGPDNCRWATRREQRDNARNTHRLEHEGLTLTIHQWAERSGIKRGTLYRRIVERGWDISRALNTPEREYRRRRKHDYGTHTNKPERP